MWVGKMYKKKIEAYRNRKPKQPKLSEINRLIQTELDYTKRHILLLLKGLNKKAYIHMMQPNQKYGVKYSSMQKEPFWDEAKQLLIEYTEDKRCGICKSNATNDFVLHHTKYRVSEIFCPTFCSLVHNSCHRRHHKK